MIVELVILWLTVFILYSYYKRPKGLPPGEWGYPFIGCLPPRDLPILDYLKQLKNKHGRTFSLKLGERLNVFITDYSLIKSTFSKPELSGRPDFFTIRLFMLQDNLGIVGSENQTWHENRRFALNQLRDLGLGRSILEETIAREVTAFLDDLNEKLDKPMNMPWSLNLAILNVIWALVASKRYDLKDQELLKFSETLNKELETMQGPMTYLDMFPTLEPYVPSIIKNKWMKVDFLEKTNKGFHNFLTKIIEDHKKNLNPDDPKDYIDSYLLEIEKTKDKNDGTFKPDYLNLEVSISDLFIAGSETTSTTIRYTCLYLILNPKVQEKIHKEIDEVLPRDTRPSLEHREKLVYLDATILEVQRMCCLLPLCVPHTALQDTTIDGYKIPKGTVVHAFQEDCHTNPKYWEKPDEFNPNRFIDKDGKLITKKDGFLPFSVGRRVCPGESLAKMELYLFLSAILQKFKLSKVPTEDLKIDMDRNRLLLNTIKPYNLIFTLRK